jgi:hypothetical protein
MSTRGLKYAHWLWFLTILFLIRVVAQPLALVVDSPLLPRFEVWHSGALPYPLLVASQLVILAAMAWAAVRLSSGRVAPSRRTGLVLLWAGAVYFGTMLIRLIVGLVVPDPGRWFASLLPTLFHLVLASFLLVLARFHLHARGTGGGRA